MFNTGDVIQETGDRTHKTGDRETGDMRQETGRQETGDGMGDGKE